MNLLFKIFLSTNSSAVGRIESLRINRAPIASFVSCWSFSDCNLKIFLLINSCRSGRSASFNDKLSFLAILAARSVPTGSSRYRIGPSFESLSSSSFSWTVLPFCAPYGLVFSLFSNVHGKPIPNRIGRELNEQKKGGNKKGERKKKDTKRWDTLYCKRSRAYWILLWIMIKMNKKMYKLLLLKAPWKIYANYSAAIVVMMEIKKSGNKFHDGSTSWDPFFKCWKIFPKNFKYFFLLNPSQIRFLITFSV